jgi:hypothetical protein
MIKGKFQNCIPPAAIKDNASFTVTSTDTLGYSKATFVFALGASDIAMAALKLQESDDDSSYADVTGLVYGTSTNIAGSTSALPSATDDNKIYLLHIANLSGRKRYLKLVATAGDGATGTFGSAIAILENADVQTFDTTGYNVGDVLSI